MNMVVGLQCHLMIVLAVFYFCGYFHSLFNAVITGPLGRGDLRKRRLLRRRFAPSRNDSQYLMIKNKCLYTQRDNPSIHKGSANINVIAFGQANLINNQQRA